MRKTILIIVAALALMLAAPMAWAADGPGGHEDGGMHGSRPSGTVHAPGSGGREHGPGFRDEHGGGDRFRGGDHDRDWHGGGGGVWIGPGWDPLWYPWWWGGGYYPYPTYPSYPYYPYGQPPVIMEPQETAPMYQEPAQEPNQQPYWYYCNNPEGYYPYIKECPGGWKRVVPTPPPAGGGQ